MMRKLYVLITALAAGSAVAADKKTHNISLGLQGGYVAHNMSVDTSIKTNAISENKSVDLHNNSGSVGAFLSYVMYLKSNIFAGLEVYGQYQKSEASQNNLSLDNGSLKVDVNMKESYGGNFLLGFTHDKISPFFKIGYVNTKFETKTSFTAGTATTNPSSSTRKGGLLIGLGADYMLNKKWSLGAYGDYSWYGSVNHTTFTSTSGATSIKHSYKPRALNVGLRLKYTF